MRLTWFVLESGQFQDQDVASSDLHRSGGGWAIIYSLISVISELYLMA